MQKDHWIYLKSLNMHLQSTVTSCTWQCGATFLRLWWWSKLQEAQVATCKPMHTLACIGPSKRLAYWKPVRLPAAEYFVRIAWQGRSLEYTRMKTDILLGFFEVYENKWKTNVPPTLWCEYLFTSFVFPWEHFSFIVSLASSQLDCNFNQIKYSIQPTTKCRQKLLQSC